MIGSCTVLRYALALGSAVAITVVSAPAYAVTPAEADALWRAAFDAYNVVVLAETREAASAAGILLKKAMTDAQSARAAFGQEESELAINAQGIVLYRRLALSTAAACNAKTEVENAKTAEEAKAAGKLATEAGQEAAAEYALVTARGDASAQPRSNAAVAKQCAKYAKDLAYTKEKAGSSLCGLTADGRVQYWCAVYGLTSASLSYATPLDGASTVFGGRSTSQVVAVASPFVAARYTPAPASLPILAIDLGLYSSFLTTNLNRADVKVQKSSCSRSGGDFEVKLPCESQADIHPYAAIYLGITLGRQGLSYFTIAPLTIGIAQVGSAQQLRPFAAVTLSALQINGTF